jgi:hypothetical protein
MEYTTGIGAVEDVCAERGRPAATYPLIHDRSAPATNVQMSGPQGSVRAPDPVGSGGPAAPARREGSRHG